MGLYEELSLGAFKNATRLIRFRAHEKWDDPILADIEVVDLDSEPKYACLSHRWASAELSTHIPCVPVGSGVTFLLRVPTGLVSALRSARAASDLPLWCDQICINQEDLAERASQVSIMGRIYAQGQETLMYLGEPETDIHDADCHLIKTLYEPCWAKILDRQRERVKTQHLLPLAMDPDPDDDPIETLTPHTDLTYYKIALKHPRIGWKGFFTPTVERAAKVFSQNPYFTRKWIIQEVALSRKATCLIGKHQIDAFVVCWVMFHDMGPWIDRIGWLGYLTLRNMWYEAPRATPLLTLLFYSRFFECSDPRDHVFALLGLTATATRFPQPNYEIPVEELYLQVSQTLVREASGFLMLRLAGIHPPSSTLPSWAIDFRSLATTYASKDYISFSAGGRDGVLALGADPTTLLAQGRITHRISAVAPPLSSSPAVHTRLTTFLDAATTAFIPHLGPTEPTTSHALRSKLLALLTFSIHYAPHYTARPMFFFDTQNADILHFADAAIALDPSIRVRRYASAYTLEQLKRAVTKGERRGGVLGRCARRVGQACLPDEMCTSQTLVECAVVRGLLSGHRVRPIEWEEVARRLRFFAEGTRAVLVEKGGGNADGDGENREWGVGLAPSGAEVGDVVCVIRGAQAPFVLRPDGRGRYRVVGEAYVDGIMFGESLEKGREESEGDGTTEEKTGEWEDIVLC